MVNLETRLKEIKLLIERGAFFSINRGRQYGKTTMLHALKKYIQDDYTVAHLDFQMLGESSFENEYVFAYGFSKLFIRTLRGTSDLDEKILEKIRVESENKKINLLDLFEHLSDLCATARKPVVLLIDEVDSASNNQVFLDFLAQLRGYYLNREELPTFQSVILAGVYDIRNLKRKLRPDVEHKINSPWNIATEFNVNMEFSKEDIEGMLAEYEYDQHTGMDINVIAQMIFDYTAGYPLLVSKLCKIIDEKSSPNNDCKVKSKAWTKESVLEAINDTLMETNALFESLLRQLREYSELNDMIYAILFQGISIGFNPDNHVIDIATMFGFIKNVDGRVAIANRIFETRLYNYYISEEDAKSSISHAGNNNRKQFISDGFLDMDLIMERFSVEFNNLYHGVDDKFIEDNGRKFFLLFLKPIINGTGNYYVEARTRDNRRTDLIVNYHGIEYIIECKIWHGEEYNKRGEKQLADYLDIYEAKKGWLLSFNFNKNKVPGMKEIRCGDKTIVEVVV
jgi:hypothetical protein